MRRVRLVLPCESTFSASASLLRLCTWGARPLRCCPHRVRCGWCAAHFRRLVEVIRRTFVVHVILVQVAGWMAQHAALTGMPGDLAPVLSERLEDVKLAPVRPLHPCAEAPKGGPHATAEGHMRDAQGNLRITGEVPVCVVVCVWGGGSGGIPERRAADGAEAAAERVCTEKQHENLQ